MMVFIVGGSGSGKSAYAEDYLVSISGGRKKYYIAAMKAHDAECERKIERHRRLREGKGFSTIEQPVDIQRAAEKMDSVEKTAILECISNLTANEMFADTEPKTEAYTVEKIVDGVVALSGQVAQLVIVSNNVFEDGKTYDDTTMGYIEAMGRINEKLAGMADEVIEVIAGIPVAIKPRKGQGERKTGCTF